MRRHHNHLSTAALCAGIAAAACNAAGAATTAYGPTPYLSSADSPFIAVSFDVFQLEDFEDGALNATGVSATHGGSVIGPQPQADSVDADDGVLDGSGAAGRSFYSGAVTTVLGFSFDESVLGTLPTHVGLVWTDVGFLIDSSPGGFGDVVFQAFDATDQLVISIDGTQLGDGSTFGGTAEDRFFGAQHDAGILRITLTMPNSVDFEVDHLQYGVVSPVPLPGGLILMTPLAAWLARRGRQRGKA
ncbi:MAG: hypothetical protein H6978_15140 [Gammaproteobacteria bacterium]|nr:hypothetical protein [Gammaproteobacteria bacterium]